MSVTCAPRDTTASVATISPQTVGQRLSDSFDQATDLPKRFLPWVRDHAAAIVAARALLESLLTVEINAACADAQREGQTELTPGEWCDLLEHQLHELRALEGADSDIAEPDTQARARLVKIAGMAIAFVDKLDRWTVARVGDAE